MAADNCSLGLMRRYAILLNGAKKHQVFADKEETMNDAKIYLIMKIDVFTFASGVIYY